jgi:single-strand DNA-binding protein
MASMNKVFLLGNLTRDPQLRALPSGVAVCDFGIAVNRKWRDRDGNQKDETCFVDCTAWARQAETINEHCRKGRALLVVGRLKLDTWEDQDGNKRSKHTVTVEEFQFVGAKDSAGNNTGNNVGGVLSPAAQAQAKQTQPPTDPADGFPQSGDADIPF